MSDGNEKLYDLKKRSDVASLRCLDPSLTVQSDAIDADINVIVARFGITGKMPDNVRLPSYGDFDGVDSFLEAQMIILEGDKEFMRLPADIRAKFDNSAGVFFDIAANPENYDYLVELGLAKARPIVDNVVADVPLVTTE